MSIKIAVLDDSANVSQRVADWSVWLSGYCCFHRHVEDRETADRTVAWTSMLSA